VTGSGGNLTVTSGTLTVAEGRNNIDDGKTGRFGFAVECRPSCSMRRLPSGEYAYKYDGYPVIIAVRERSAADRAGLRVGDVITRVNGKSILEDEGTLQRVEQQEQVRLTVRREGKGDLEVLLLVTR
jgi:S1-C subfamily serine protease